MMFNNNEIYVLDFLGCLVFTKKFDIQKKEYLKEHIDPSCYFKLSDIFPNLSVSDIIKKAIDYPYSIDTYMLDTRAQEIPVSLDIFSFVVCDKKFFLIYVKKMHHSLENDYENCLTCKNKYFENNFISNVTHELKTPLNSIIGTCQIALNKSSVDLKQIERIFKSSKDLLNRIEDLFAISKIDNAKGSAQKSNFSIKKIISDIIKKYEGDFKTKGLIFNINISKEIPEILYGNYRTIYDVISKLILIALRISDKGSLGLILDYEKKQEISGHNILFRFFCSTIKSHQNKINGSDNFLNLNELGMEYKAAQSKTEKAGSILSYKRYMKRGVEFNFLLSFNSEERLFKESSADVSNSLKVLVVDDIKVILTMVTKMFEIFGINIKCCESGERAIEILKDEIFDIIFIDLELNGISGYGATVKIREMYAEKLLKTPIIAMTAHSSDSIAHKLKSHGIDDYLIKPFSLNDISFILNKWIYNKGWNPINNLSKVKEVQLEIGNSIEKKIDDIFKHNDIDYKSALLRVGNKPDFYFKLIKEFLNSNRDIKKNLKSVFLKSGINGLKKEFHKIKGTALNLGFMGLSSKIFRAEKILTQVDDDFDIDFEIELIHDCFLPILKLEKSIAVFLSDFECKNEFNTKSNLDYKNIDSIILKLDKILSEYKPRPCIELVDQLKKYSFENKFKTFIIEIEKFIKLYDFEAAKSKNREFGKIFRSDYKDLIFKR